MLSLLFCLCAAQAALLHPQHLAEIKHDLTELRQQTKIQALNVWSPHTHLYCTTLLVVRALLNRPAARDRKALPPSTCRAAKRAANTPRLSRTCRRGTAAVQARATAV